MRALIRHTRTFSCTSTVFVVNSILLKDMTTATNRRDLYFRAMDRTGVEVPSIYAFKTLTAASATFAALPLTDALKTAAGVVGYVEGMTLSGNTQTETFTNHIPVTPDVTTLRARINGAGDLATWDGVWAYTSSPAAMVLDEIDYILRQYMASGQALEGFSSARLVKGPDGMQLVSSAPHIIAAIADEPEIERQAGYFATSAMFTIIVGSRGIYNKGEDNYCDVMTYAGNVRSILADENIQLNGVTCETVIGSVEGPTLIEGETEPYVAARVNGLCRFPVLYSDKT